MGRVESGETARVAASLGIPHYVVNYIQRFEDILLFMRRDVDGGNRDIGAGREVVVMSIPNRVRMVVKQAGAPEVAAQIVADCLKVTAESAVQDGDRGKGRLLHRIIVQHARPSPPPCAA